MKQTVSRMEKLDRSIVVAAISQWRRRFSACVLQAHGGHFEHILWCFHSSVNFNV